MFLFNVKAVLQKWHTALDFVDLQVCLKLFEITYIIYHGNWLNVHQIY